VLGACAVRPPEAPPTQIEAPPPRAWAAPTLGELRAVAEEASEHGLASESATVAELARLDVLSQRDAGAARRLDEAAGMLFDRLALAFATGAIDPAQVDLDWRIPRAPAPDLGALRAAVAAGASPRATLQALLPATPDYGALVAELSRVLGEERGARDALGLSRETRVLRLRASLERLRWLPRTWPARYIEVLAPFFELRVWDGENVIASHAVIVGARATTTPSFTAAIESVTLNPSWTPPASIAAGELLPRFRRDPGAAAREGFDVIDAHGRILDPASVDWRARPFPYALRQRPGPGNALGRLRFDLPNPHAVFLHDTPSRGLFSREDRALSHGCIRVAEPVALAETVLADVAWSAATLEAAIAEGNTQVIPLRQALPVYLLYLTARADGAGAVDYGSDVYDRDERLVRALDAGVGAGAGRASLNPWLCGVA
jgi:L,D-transpeptidase YcbB